LISRKGEVLAEAKAFEEDLMIIDTEKDLKAIKVSQHSDVETVYSALVLGLRDYVRKNGLKNIVVGISGGIDSALCSVIASDAIGPKNVTCVTMPTRFSSKGSVTHSQELCKNLGTKFIKLSIEDIFSDFSAGLKKGFGKMPSDIALENIQPRIRGTALMAYTNSMPGTILIAPGNKSEIAVGYCTLYGDTCGALAVIGDVYKTEVYELAKFINRKKVIIPKSIIDKEPSAELRPPYEVLDEILRLYIEGQFSPKEIYKKVSAKKELVDKVIDIVIKSEFKRRQLPPVIKVSSKAFVLDRRWPVVHKFR
jgi:NAD+ synthetase